MSISAEYSGHHNELIIRAGEVFDIRCRSALLAMLGECDARVHCVFDFSRTRQADSSGVGLLIGLRQQLGGFAARMTLINCRPEVLETFMFAGLDGLFNIRRPLPQAS
jgi:anti-anti-sigma factor